jgi:hypothetical protein
MTWHQALDEIQTQEFAAKLNVASGFRSFFRAASEEPAVATLFKAVLESGETREEVFGRILDLSSLDVDIRYENPNDTALAVLL